MTSTELLQAVLACRDCSLLTPLMCPVHDGQKKELEQRATEPVEVLAADDPRQQRALALRQLMHARFELQRGLDYLRNSDAGSVVLEDLQRLIDKAGHLQHTLEWRQRREGTP